MKGARRRANKDRPRTTAEKAVRVRLVLIAAIVLVPILALINWQVDPREGGPFGLDIGTWLLITGVLYVVVAVVGFWAVWWLARNDQLPKER